MLTIPLWLVAVAVAALAPFGARLLASAARHRIELRTRALTSHLFRNPR